MSISSLPAMFVSHLRASDPAPASSDPVKNGPAHGEQPMRETGEASRFSRIDAIPRTLVQSLGERHLTLKQNADGSVDLHLDQPPLRALILQGGGAKGMAIPGLLQALEEKGALDAIREVRGTSVGSIMAFAVACGMSAAAVKELVNSLNIVELLHGKLDARAPEGYISQHTNPLGYLPGGFFKTLGKLGANAVPLQEKLNRAGRESVLMHISNWLDTNNASAPRFNELQKMHGQLNNGQNLTLGMLRTASRAIPQIKEFSCAGARMDEELRQVQLFSADNEPDMEAAGAIVASAALPLAFRPARLASAFQEAHELTTRFEDGGVFANTPLDSLLNYHAPSPVPDLNKLIVEFQEPGPPNTGGSTLFTKVSDQVAGAEMYAWDGLRHMQMQRLENRMQRFEVPLKIGAGDFTGATKDFAMPTESRLALQQASYEAGLSHLQNRSQTPIRVAFNSMEQCLWSLDPQELQLLSSNFARLVPAQVASQAEEILMQRTRMESTIGQLENAVRNQPDSLNLNDLDLQGALFELDRMAQQNQEPLAYLERRLNNPDSKPLQRWLSAVNQNPVPLAPGTVAHAAQAEYDRRNVQQMALLIQREIIFPGIQLYRSPQDNIGMLKDLAAKLEQASTQGDLYAILDELKDTYRPRLLWPGESWIVEQADKFQQRLRVARETGV